MTHDELRELVPVYALDAVADNERLEMQGHLDSCPACRAALEEYLVTAGRLAMLAEPVTPPAALRTRLLQSVAETALAAPAPTPITTRRRQKTWTWQRISAVVAVAAVLALGVFSLTLERRLHDANQTVAQQRHFLASLGSPLASTVPLVGAGNAANASGVLYLLSDGSAGLVARGLANPGRNIYQLWLITNNQPAPVEAFRPDSSGMALVSIRTNLSGMQAMAVTVENHAGKPAPQGPFVLHSA